MNAREYYLAQLNKIAKISKAVAESPEFSNFVEVAYDEDGSERNGDELGYISMLHLFLYQVHYHELASSEEFDELMRDYDINKIFNSTLREASESLIVVNGILIDQKNEDAF